MQAFETDMLQQIGIGNCKRIKNLLASGMDVNTRDAATGNSFLHWAVTFGQVEVTKLFLDKGADVALHNNSGKTPDQIAKGEVLKLFQSAATAIPPPQTTATTTTSTTAAVATTAYSTSSSPSAQCSDNSESQSQSRPTYSHSQHGDRRSLAGKWGCHVK